MCTRSNWHVFLDGDGRCTAYGCDGTFGDAPSGGSCALVLVVGAGLAAAAVAGLLADPTATLATVATISQGVAR